ncbi:hypothetical protein E8E15_001700 [Penicillium rubens]|nr:hypothetical protein E8E15_001700 [Penicillium rubens]
MNITTATIRRLEDWAPALAGVRSYPDTANIYRLISAECPDTRDIIINFTVTMMTSLPYRILPTSRPPYAISAALSLSLP